VDRYLSPVSGSSTTIFFPLFSGLFASSVAAYIANLNVDTIDVGVPVLSMHAPFETVAKIDVYMTYRAFQSFIS